MTVEKLTRAEYALKLLMALWAILFPLAGLIFVIAPDTTIRAIEWAGRTLVGWQAAPVVLGNERFWLVLTASMMATITGLAVLSYRALARGAVREYQGAVQVLLLSKAVSTLGFLFCLAALAPSPIYCAGAFVDGSILCITWGIYHRAMLSRTSAKGVPCSV